MELRVSVSDWCLAAWIRMLCLATSLVVNVAPVAQLVTVMFSSTGDTYCTLLSRRVHAECLRWTHLLRSNMINTFSTHNLEQSKELDIEFTGQAINCALITTYGLICIMDQDSIPSSIKS